MTSSLPSQPEPPSQPKKLIFAPGIPSKPPSAPSAASDAISASHPAPAPQQAQQYHLGSLSRTDLHPSPTIQFQRWFATAQSSGVHQPETVCLSTASLPSGRVSSRMVYLKELDSRGWVVYSNWDTSRKGADVRTNPHASLCFWWREMERQVRVEGTVERLSSEESQVYFDTRIRGSRVGAWASRQSEVLVGGREELEDRVREVEGRFEGKESIPVPEFWGGLRVRPESVEFWQGRPSRLHDRFRYTRVENGEEGGGRDDGGELDNMEWKIERLSP